MTRDTVFDARAPYTGTRYTGTAQMLHWLGAGLVFAALPLAWVMAGLAGETADKALLYTLHKSVGLTVLALAVVRLAWRTTHPAPPLRHVARWEQAVSTVSHWLLYAILVLMPVSGYVMSAASGAPGTWFGLFPVPGLPNSKLLADAGRTVHLATQWAVYALVLLHVAGAAWHVAVRRDGTLDRMLPPQRAADPDA